MLIGTAKQIPCAGWMIAVLMPTTRPAESTSGPPRVAGVQGRVGLDDVVHQVSGDAPQRPAQRRDDARGHGGLEPERAADRDRELPDLELRRVAERRERERVALGLHDREVGPRVVADDAAGQLGAVVEPHADLLAAPARRGGS